MWMEQIAVALITAGLGLVGVMITNYFSNKSLSDKVTHQLEVAQAVTDTKIEELTREVRTHNNFAQRIPVMEEKISVANHRIDDLERHEEKWRENLMQDFWKNVAALIKVKTIVTLIVVTVFAVLALRGGLQPDTVMTIVTMVIAFYFGIQSEGKNNGK